MQWLEDLLTRKEDGSYPVADKLIGLRMSYGFDGWFNESGDRGHG